jgi:hypothetical protein
MAAAVLGVWAEMSAANYRARLAETTIGSSFSEKARKSGLKRAASP